MNKTQEQYTECRCARCGCSGNIHCDRDKPLAAPEHLCELDINGPNERHICYCCVTELAEAAGFEEWWATTGWGEPCEEVSPKEFARRAYVAGQKQVEANTMNSRKD